jgi:DEAD/DEAH box helicase domain-containing protein
MAVVEAEPAMDELAAPLTPANPVDPAKPANPVGHSIEAVLAALAADGRLIHVEHQAARPATVAALALPLPPAVAHCLPPGGLWSHQAKAIDLVRDGHSVVVATGTASGKSLCYQIPIAESVVTGLRAGTSLLLYPTKALAQDQLRSFGQLRVPGLVATTYDGDASREDRSWARANANVVLTNPEMLHHGILPSHVKWATFLKRLDYVVVDELHVLRGIFGTHVAHLLRRLRRLCHRYGSDPTFVFSSATIGQPAQLAAELCHKPVVAVTADGSPCGDRHIAIVQPAIVQPAIVQPAIVQPAILASPSGGDSNQRPGHRGARQSPATETIRTVAELVTHGHRVIAFCASRSLTERVALGVARALPPHLAGTVRPYRSGYLAAERREIEAELVAGSLRAVIATSALELGVDISGLDATVLCGFPGTIASLWQQIGRSGRAMAPSLSVLVAGDDQLDQWFVNHPHDLFARPPEPVVVNVENPNIRDPHLGCAAYEMPLQPHDDRWWHDLDDGVRRSVLADELRVRPGRNHEPQAVWAGRGMPFHRIGLRSTSGGEVRILDEGDELIGTVEESRACNLVHPGAIYLHRGQPWRVAELDLAARVARVQADDGTTWTQARSDIAIDVLEMARSKRVGTAQLHLGLVQVTTTVTGYQVKGHASRGVLANHELSLPPQVLTTTAIWYDWAPDMIQAAGVAPHALPGALHAAEHAAIGILPLFTICDRWDVGGVSTVAGGPQGLPTVFIYDGYPGGVGVANLAFDAADRHLAATAEVLERCGCATGCPSCVQSPKCGNGNDPLDRWAALALVRCTLGDAEPF